jgi:hypothetical protein
MATKLNLFEERYIQLNKTKETKDLAKENRVVAISALKTQIAILEGRTISLERAVVKETKRTENALVNHGQDMGEEENAGVAYVQEILDAEQALISAQESLGNHNKMLDILKEKLDLIS